MSLATSIASTIYTGVAYDVDSKQFWNAVAGTTVGYVGGKFKDAVSAGAGLVPSVGTRAKQALGDAVGSIYSGITELFG